MSEQIRNNPDRWPFENQDGTWNVEKAQDKIYHVLRCAKFPELTSALAHIYSHTPELAQAFKDAVAEMADVIENKDNRLGYHLNYICSGTNVFCVYDNSDGVYVSAASDEYDTKEEAQAAAEGIENVRIEEDHGKWLVMTLDTDTTEDCWENNWGGVFVADFESREEAEAELASYEHGYIQEFPSEEYWNVVSNETGKSAFRMMFPTQSRALAFLYKEIDPPCWRKYIDVQNAISDAQSDKEKAGE